MSYLPQHGCRQLPLLQHFSEFRMQQCDSLKVSVCKMFTTSALHDWLPV